MAKDKNKNLSVAVQADKMANVRKFQKELELATISEISIGGAIYLACSICSRILAGEKPTKADILKGAQVLTNG